MRRIELSALWTTSAPRPSVLRRVLPRAEVDVGAALQAVTPLVEDVAARGYAAAREATMRFDGVDVADPRVPSAALQRALDELDPAVRDALTESIRRARIVHEAQRRAATEVDVVPGGTVSE